MNTENKEEDYYKKSQLPWPAAIVFNLFILALVILLIFGLVKLVKFFWLL
jgi:hypothetical protein